MTPETGYEKLLTPAQCAAMFAVDPKTTSRWAKAGKLTAYRTPGGHRRFKESEVRALLEGSVEERVTDPLDAPAFTLWPAGRAPAVAGKLAREGVTTVRMLTALTAAGLRDRGFKPPQVDEVRLALARKGLALRGEVLASKAA